MNPLDRLRSTLYRALVLSWAIPTLDWIVKVTSREGKS